MSSHVLTGTPFTATIRSPTRKSLCWAGESGTICWMIGRAEGMPTAA